jgi:hypothetical protein
MKNTLIAALGALLLCGVAVPAEAVVIEADPDIQLVMGDLSALAVAMRLHREGTRGTACPSVEQLAAYLEAPLYASPNEEFRTADADGAWWVGRRVPEYSRARAFLRANAELLGLYDRESTSFWMGGAFVWMRGITFEHEGSATAADIRVAPGDGKDVQYLFFSSPGTNRYWWSRLIYTPAARKAALEKSGTKESGPFVVPPAPPSAKEKLSASPVFVPPEFSVGPESDDLSAPLEMGDVIFNPIPRPRGNN